jgi:hypothetical protein
MKIPPAFDKLSNMFHQDWDIVFNSLDEAISESARPLTRDEKTAAKEFLDQILTGRYSDADLAEMWNETSGGAGGFCIESGATWFLDRLRTALIESL